MAKIKLVVSATIEKTFSDFIISKKTKGLAEKTLQSYQAQFQAVARHLDVKMDIAMLQKADLDAMIISMRTAHLSPNSINSYTRTLKSFFSWCNEQGITRLNIPLYKAEETVKETYSDLELSALLKKPDIRKATFAEYRDWVIINFLLNCGSWAATVRAIHTELQLGSIWKPEIWPTARDFSSGEAIFPQKYFVYCKGKWCTADGKDPLFGRVDGFQIDPKIFKKDFNCLKGMEFIWDLFCDFFPYKSQNWQRH